MIILNWILLSDTPTEDFHINESKYSRKLLVLDYYRWQNCKFRSEPNEGFNFGGWDSGNATLQKNRAL